MSRTKLGVLVLLLSMATAPVGHADLLDRLVDAFVEIADHTELKVRSAENRSG